MGWLQIVVFVYGLLMLGGGIGGYKAAGSVQSLVTGIVSGVLLMGCALASGRHPRVGYGGAAVITLALIIVFLKRCLETHWAPRNIGLLGLSAVVLGLLVTGHFLSSGSTPVEPPAQGK